MEEGEVSLPFELLLQIATDTPPAWWSLVRTFRLLALYVRHSEKFRSGLERRFSRREEEEWASGPLLPSGLRHGRWREWGEDPEESSLFNYSRGLEEGPQVLRRPLPEGGTRVVSWFSVGGKKEGSEITREPSYFRRRRFACGVEMGRRLTSTPFGREEADVLCGKISGLCRGEWRGRLQSLTSFFRGRRHGPRETFWGNGQLQSLDSWERGKRSGLLSLYTQEGFLCERARFEEGREGETESWYRGSLVCRSSSRGRVSSCRSLFSDLWWEVVPVEKGGTE